MSGFLSRLVHSAAHPSESVHPATRPLYAPASVHLFPEAEEIVVSPSANKHSDVPTPREHQFVEASNTAEFFPATDAGQPEPAQLHQIEPETLVRTEGYAVPQMQFRERERTVLPEEPMPERTRVEYLPLVAAMNANFAPPAVLPNATRQAQLPSERNAKTSSLPAPRLDEITIHIGRIEVTAVPQQAAKLPVKSSSDRISLHDYLGRSERRAS